MSSPSSILVIGAGELGEAVFHALAAHPNRNNIPISLLMRPASITSTDPTKQQLISTLKAQNINTVPGNIVNDSDDDLAKTFSNYHTIIACSGMGMPAGTQLRVAKAIVASDCKRYFPWQYGIDYDIIGRESAQDLFTEQLDVRDLLRGQTKVEWVVVSTGIFTSFIFEPIFGIVNAGRDTVNALGSWENRVTATAPEDIGKCVAQIALACPDIQGIVFTAGDKVSMRQIADITESVLGRKVKRVEKTVEMLQGELKEKQEDAMRKYRIVFAEGKGIAWEKSESFNEKNGIKTVTVEEWARKNLK